MSGLMTVILNKVPSSANTLLLILFSIGFLALAQDPFDFDLSDSQIKNPLQVSGYIESRNQYFTVQDDWSSNRLASFLELKWEDQASQAQQWRAYSSLLLEYDSQTRAYRNSQRIEFKELYILHDGANFDLTIGKQRVAWGTADGVSTIDRVNAVDLRDPISNARTASKRPSWVVRNEFNLSGGILELIWLPRGRDRKLPEFGSPWEPAYLHALRVQNRSGRINFHIEDPHKHEGGIRYATYGEGFDWSLAYFNGYTDSPVRQSITSSDVFLEPIRIQTFNASGALGMAQGTLRAELAYTPNNIVSGKTTDLWQIVLGWDRNFFTNLYFNLQLFYNEASRGVDTYGSTFSISNTSFDDAGSYGLRGQILDDNQLATEIYFEYDFNDKISSSCKYLFFDGDNGSGLFDYRDNDLFEATLRWNF